MNRHEFANLIAQTQPTMKATGTNNRSASAKATSSLCNQLQSLSPRQKFQSHIRTLSQESTAYSKDASVAPYSPSPSSSPSPSPSPTSNTYRYSETALRGGRYTQHEPQFITEEREAWARPSPTETRRGRNPTSEDTFVLQPPRDQSPVQQPRKHLRELRAFAPSSQSADINERPKTSRGSKVDFGKTAAEEDQDLQLRNSKFAEGSMTARSAGLSSTWLESGSISTMSGDDSDDQSTPRASPQRSTVDFDNLKPTAITPGTFKQRLARIGSAFKAAHHSNKPEVDTQDAKKRKGLRKSMSLWNLNNISGKTKTVGAQSILDLNSVAADPQKTTADHDLEVLNDRKRRAEVAYAQQFGTKKRKSNVGIPEPIAEPQQEQPPQLRDDRTVTRRSMRSSVSTRRLSHSSSTMGIADISDSQRDIDSHKRPSRRELEKENQQLRAMLRQQEDANHKTPKPAVARNRSSSTTKIAAFTEPSPTKQETKSASKKKTTKSKTKDIPPVPSVPDRVALQPLSNARNQSRSTSISNNANINNNAFVDLKLTASANTNNTNTGTSNNNPTKRTSTNSSSGNGNGPLTRPVSMILEEDEESIENRTPSGKSSLKIDDIAKLKQLTPSPVRLYPAKREQWEWPDDIF
ncbi:hypothetical protein LTR84_008327 [Exophiala bonariae]|uniref:DUF4045 domain-containing protein n=1 Tax=Exophiala bonariae TaxID=1690606 RepID=A0AAV9MXV8_9EURO|nr:hypothetical protein LTR84_008327 [Exophiala bonariae]